MKLRRYRKKDLTGRIIDVHSHLGVSLKMYACQEYPFAETLEGLRYRQIVGGVDVNVVFPFTPDLFFDPVALCRGQNVPAQRPLSPAPYAVENERVLRDVYSYCPEFQGHFLPFVSIDPGRAVKAQLRRLDALAEEFPIYGIKVNPILCQSRITELLDRGRPLVDWARQHNLPFLLHTTSEEEEQYSRASLAFQVVERYPDMRFCLAHVIAFHKDFLLRADALPNVWVDTGAFTILTRLVRQSGRFIPRGAHRLEGDFRHPGKVMRNLVERFPDTIVWGTDTPAYSYICRRKQAEGLFHEFRLKANYEDEVAALNALPPKLRRKVANQNTLDFIFG